MVRPFISIPGVEVLEELGRGAHNTVFRVRRGGRYYATKIPGTSSYQLKLSVVRSWTNLYMD